MIDSNEILFKYMESEGHLYFDRTFMSLNLWGSAADVVLSRLLSSAHLSIRL